jgi:hypothetical protein
MGEITGDPNQFVIHRLRAKPIEYTVKIRHFVSGGRWMIGVQVNDLEDSDRARLSVADDLRRVADIVEDDAK